jgi:hypothetical protein
MYGGSNANSTLCIKSGLCYSCGHVCPEFAPGPQGCPPFPVTGDVGNVVKTYVKHEVSDWDILHNLINDLHVTLE